MRNLWKIGEITLNSDEDGNRCLETLENAGFVIAYEKSDTEIIKADICVESK